MYVEWIDGKEEDVNWNLREIDENRGDVKEKT